MKYFSRLLVTPPHSPTAIYSPAGSVHLSLFLLFKLLLVALSYHPPEAGCWTSHQALLGPDTVAAGITAIQHLISQDTFHSSEDEDVDDGV